MNERRSNGCLWYWIIKALIIGGIILARQQSAHNRMDTLYRESAATAEAKYGMPAGSLPTPTPRPSIFQQLGVKP